MYVSLAESWPRPYGSTRKITEIAHNYMASPLSRVGRILQERGVASTRNKDGQVQLNNRTQAERLVCRRTQ